MPATTIALPIRAFPLFRFFPLPPNHTLCPYLPRPLSRFLARLCGSAWPNPGHGEVALILRLPSR